MRKKIVLRFKMQRYNFFSI